MDKKTEEALDLLERARDALVKEALMEEEHPLVKEIDEFLRPQHKGVKCAFCREPIKREKAGTSTPHGSAHKWCAVRYEYENPVDW